MFFHLTVKTIPKMNPKNKNNGGRMLTGLKVLRVLVVADSSALWRSGWEFGTNSMMWWAGGSAIFS
jgi:hypothetical protein